MGIGTILIGMLHMGGIDESNTCVRPLLEDRKPRAHALQSKIFERKVEDFGEGDPAISVKTCEQIISRLYN